MSELELLEKIVKNTKPKTSFQIIVSSNSASFSTLVRGLYPVLK